MRWVVWFCVVLTAACVRPESVTCRDGNLCASGLVCAEGRQLCVTLEQTLACADLLEADRCTAGTLEGLCNDGLCLPGCGDGVHEDEEQCDDGNLGSHDGCSSQCYLEEPVWQEWQSGWSPRSQHSTAYMAASSRLVVFGGTDDTSPTDDHWELDLDGSQRRDIPRPSPRQRAAMAYNEGTDTVVLFGGIGPDGILGDTWVYDGTSWRQVTAQPSPPARSQAALAYAGNGRVVLFGGIGTGPVVAPAFAHLDDTWEFDGTTWTQVTSTPRPTPRRAAVLAWAPFPGAERAVLFGGVGLSSPSVGFLVQLSDQWSYAQGTGWIAVPTALPRPPSRYSAAMAFSPRRNALVLFGGGSAAQPFSDTWTFDGSTWTAVTGPVNPAGRTDATLTTFGQDVALIAGTATEGAVGDIWVFTQLGWQLGQTPGVPGVRGTHELVYDVARHVALTIGGYREPTPLVEVRAFDAALWRPSAALPTPARARAVSTYDASRERVVVFGGQTFGGQSLAQTDVLGPAGWSTLPGPQPPARLRGALAFDARTQVSVLFGGTGPNQAPLADTWTLDASGWSQRMFASSPSGQHEPALAFDDA
nr:hypothetical protein [Deltaproteobacteria bacterium]